ncbi:MAG: iron chaperone [Micrococcales bacterium]
MKKTSEQERGEFDAAVEAMSAGEQALARALVEAVAQVAPQLEPRLFYSMPAFALDGKTICFFQSATKFKTRYCTLGFTDTAKLDDGTFWPTSFALSELTPEVETELRKLLARAVGK